MVYKLFDKNSTTHTRTEINFKYDCENQKLAEDLHKPNTKKSKNRKIYIQPKNLYSYYEENIGVLI